MSHNPGCFTPHNAQAAAGGRARAAALTPERRQEIARLGGKKGWVALVEKQFGGDVAAAKEFIGRRGAWAADVAAYGDDGLKEHRIAKPSAYVRPLAPWELHALIVPECTGEDAVDAAEAGLLPCPF